MLPSNFPQGKFSLNIQTWNPSWGEKNPSPLLHALPGAQWWAAESCVGLATDEHEAGRAGPWGMARCPQASPSPLTRRLQAENQFPSVCPDIPSAPRLFRDFSQLNNAAHSLLSSEAQRHREAAALVLFPPAFCLLAQLLAGVLTFQTLISLETLTIIILLQRGTG